MRRRQNHDTQIRIGRYSQRNELGRLRSAVLLLGALLVISGGVHAQSSAVTSAIVQTRDAAGDPAVSIDNGASYEAGGNSSSASMELKSADDATTFLASPSIGRLLLGGGTHEGILLLKDDNGTTTTIELDGRTGVVRLGGNNEDGDLILYDNADAESIRMNGQNGYVTNELGGNGLIKAWARIDTDGTVLSCWRCDDSLTENFGPGFYRVNFGPLSADIHGRPRSATIDSHSGSAGPFGLIQVYNSPLSTSTVIVHIEDFLDAYNAPFTLLIH